MNKILFGIVTTDRDCEHIERFFNSNFKEYFFETVDDDPKTTESQIMVVCREEDKKTIRKWKKVFPDVLICTVENYQIESGKRHNYEAIQKKRNMIREYALSNEFSNLLFVDSDILFEGLKTIQILLSSSADVCMIPYGVKWPSESGKNTTYVGVFDDKTFRFELQKVSSSKEEETETKVVYKKCAIGGMGCTLLKTRKAMLVPFTIGLIRNKNGSVQNDYYGEDIGYFIEAHQQRLNVEYVSNHSSSIHHL